MLAKGAGSPIIGFNVRASTQARDLAEREGVEIRYYAIIYDLLDDIKGVLSGMLAPIQRETFLGNAEVLQVFDISKVGKVAGCRVTEGVVRKGAKVRIIREDIVVLELGTLQTLKRFKDEVNEVAVRPGVRHGLRRLPGHQGRRRHRVLHRRGVALAVESATARSPGETGGLQSGCAVDPGVLGLPHAVFGASTDLCGLLHLALRLIGRLRQPRRLRHRCPPRPGQSIPPRAISALSSSASATPTGPPSSATSTAKR